MTFETAREKQKEYDRSEEVILRRPDVKASQVPHIDNERVRKNKSSLGLRLTSLVNRYPKNWASSPHAEG